MIYNIQFSRALAALLVVFAHIGWPGMTFGHFGVDIFFVISGFIMTMICFRSPESFFLRRLVRIVPLYWLITVAVFVLSYFKPELMNSTTANPGNLLKSLFFIPYVKENGTLHPVLDVGWTLNYEMYFYLAIALSLRLVKRVYATAAAASALVVIALLLRLLLQFHPQLPASLVAPVRFYSADVTFEFLLGVGLYFFARLKIAEHVASPFSLALAVLCLFVLIGNQVNPYALPLPQIWSVGIPSSGFVAAMVLLEKRNFILLRYTILGDASYALYLTNQFVVEGYRKIGAKILHLPIWSMAGCLLVFLVASLVAVAIYRWIEKPFHDKLRTWI